jgi:hypothetical protein
VYRTLSFSVYLLAQHWLGPFIHMTQRKYVTIIWWPVHVLSRVRLYKSLCRKITISEIFTGVLCTFGGTLVNAFCKLPWIYLFDKFVQVCMQVYHKTVHQCSIFFLFTLILNNGCWITLLNVCKDFLLLVDLVNQNYFTFKKGCFLDQYWKTNHIF